MFDEKTQEFFETKSYTIQLEHSLVSVSKWESKWNKPFLGKDQKTTEQTLDYIKCMTITQNVKPEVYMFLTEKNISDIDNYINAAMTATTFADMNNTPNREIVTSEIIYYWMISMNIPFECQKWHLNRLLALINVCNIKNQPSKKMNKRDVMSRNAALNVARRREMNSRG